MNRRHEFAIIAALSIFAGLRILVFCAAFPVVSQVDEDMHFDLVLRYARGQIPHRFDLLAPETLNWLVPYASPEFLQDAEQLPDHKFSPPLWKQSGPEADAIAEATRLEWSNEINWESSQPPLYYSIAALWWRLGQLIGVKGISAIYWLRFFNAVLIAALVWVAFGTARIISPSNLICRAGVPLVVACFPQDVFFIINNDMLSAVFGGVIFLCAARVLTATSTSVSLAASTGLAIAAGYLTKVSNAPLAAIVFGAVVAKTVWNDGLFRRRAAAIGALCLTAITPIAAWSAWTQTKFGDLTGSAGKADLLGWTMKAFPDWWNHPIFSLHGLWLFWSDFTARFWRGELMWHGAQINWRSADIWYSVATLIALAAATGGLLKKNSVNRRIVALALLSFFVSVAFLIVISIAFDFGQCIYPSRAFPYLTAGRLILGELVPFAILFVYGMIHLLHPFSGKLKAAAIVLTMSLVATSQVLLDSRVFTSEHNWFHR